MGVLQGEVHRPPAYPADRLSSVDPLLILLILGPMSLLFVRSVAHIIHQPKERTLLPARSDGKGYSNYE